LTAFFPLEIVAFLLFRSSVLNARDPQIHCLRARVGRAILPMSAEPSLKHRSHFGSRY
jgi:hypothetical protein